jgi:hypothetical protein
MYCQRDAGPLYQPGISGLMPSSTLRMINESKIKAFLQRMEAVNGKIREINEEKRVPQLRAEGNSWH